MTSICVVSVTWLNASQRSQVVGLNRSTKDDTCVKCFDRSDGLDTALYKKFTSGQNRCISGCISLSIEN